MRVWCWQPHVCPFLNIKQITHAGPHLIYSMLYTKSSLFVYIWHIFFNGAISLRSHIHYLCFRMMCPNLKVNISSLISDNTLLRPKQILIIFSSNISKKIIAHTSRKPMVYHFNPFFKDSHTFCFLLFLSLWYEVKDTCLIALTASIELKML